MKKLLALTLSALFAVSAFILPNYVSGATAGDVEWVLIPENPAYPTNEYIVAGYNLGDYHYPDTDDDITGTLNSMSTKLKAAGGGTIFIPAGEYVVRGNIDLQEGVTLCGEWRAPVEGDMAASGTILKAYAGRNNPNATAFITCRPNTCVRNLTIWYPDQDPEDIVPYSDTIRLWRTGNWGADYTNVRNVTLINSYKGVVQDGGCACPNVHNLYGTTLHTGLQMDRIADIGRFDYVYLSPKYWQQSGLPGAPASGAAKTALEKHIYENAIGLNARRTDWSYWSFCYVEGYKIGLAFTECQEEGGGYCNGECYDMNFTNCQYGIYVEGISGVGQMLANINIKNCETGIYTLPDKINEYGSRKGQLNTQAGNMQFSFVSIDADTAIAHRGPERLHFLKTTIERGAVIGSWGTLTINDSDFKNDPPHIQLEKYDYEIKIDGYYEPATTTNTGGIFLGNRYKSAPALRNERLSPVQFDEEP
ncbi:MAG: hypothetical protein FWE80_08375, partial [Oscillospiraceae bacterium]|nr:hypothetical protein [Oscillospiraceae bacterium]